MKNTIKRMEKRGEKKEARSKRGQVTIFIIVAVVIVALAVLIYMFYPKIKSAVGISPKSPSDFMQLCIQDELKSSIEKVSLQGGSLNPQNYVLYNDAKVEYLCYTDEYYKQCVMQQPMLKAHVEEEIKNAIKNKETECLQSLKSSYERQGYVVTSKKGESVVELLPRRVVLSFNNSLTLEKQGTETYKELTVTLNNNLYEHVIIATSILNWEARYGDSETTTYMDYYPDLKVEKQLQTDGTKDYILTNRDKGNKFQFASRSVAWPSGYTGG